MLTVDDYAQIRRAYRDGMSLRAIARTFHHTRRTIRRALQDPEPKPYTRTGPPAAPKLDPVKALIDEILAADEQAPRKQRHTATQIHRRLVAEHFKARRTGTIFGEGGSQVGVTIEQLLAKERQ